MRKLFITLLLLQLAYFAFAQTPNRQYDSAIHRFVPRNITWPDCEDCTGVSLMEITKKDSIHIRWLYASEKTFDFSNDKRLVKRINEVLNHFIKNEYRVVVPLYFHYGETKPSDDVMKTLNKKIKKISRKSYVMEPVYLVIYPAMRKNALKSPAYMRKTGG